MNRSILITFMLLVAPVLSGQDVKTGCKAVSIQPEQVFNLSKMWHSRAYLSVEIPTNTVEWCVAFTAEPDKRAPNSIGLLAQLTRLVDPSGFTATATNALFAPEGTGRCNVMLADIANRQIFMRTRDDYRYDGTLSRVNCTHGVIHIDGQRYHGNCEILLYNPNYTTTINVRIEVSAVVREQTAEEVKATSFGILGWKAYERGEIDKCIEYSRKALALDPNMGWVQANLGLCYLIKGDQATATNYYVDAIASFQKDNSTLRRYLEIEIAGIDEALRKHPNMQGYQDIRDLLRSRIPR